MLAWTFANGIDPLGRKAMRLARWCAMWLMGALPLVWVVWTMTGRAGIVPDPAKYVTLAFADAALIMLGVTLTISTLQRRALLNLVRFRRMFGLWTFTYATLHALAALSLLWEWRDGLETVFRRPYALLGGFAWLIFAALALTSSRRWQQRLKGRWVKLHALVYLAGVLVLIHWYWLTRADYGLPLLATAIFLGLMAERKQKIVRLLRS